MQRVLWCCLGLFLLATHVTAQSLAGAKLGTIGLLNTRNPIQKDAPASQNLVSIWRVIPGLDGGVYVYDGLFGNHALLTNMTTAGGTSGWGATVRPGGFGEVRLDGTDDYLTLGAVTTYTYPNTTFTVSLWFRGSAAGGYLAAQRLAVSGSGGWFIRLDATGTLTARIMDVGNTSAANRTSVGTGYGNAAWHLATVVFTTDTVTLANNDVSIYGDGVLDQGSRTDSAVGPYSICTCDVVFGATSDHGAGTFLAGALDDIRIYNQGLSALAIRDLYTNGLQGDVGLLNSELPTTSSLVNMRGSFFPFFR